MIYNNFIPFVVFSRSILEIDLVTTYLFQKCKVINFVGIWRIFSDSQNDIGSLTLRISNCKIYCLAIIENLYFSFSFSFKLLFILFVFIDATKFYEI